MSECSAYAGSQVAAEPDVGVADAEMKTPEQISDDRDLEDVGAPEEVREGNLLLGRSLKGCRTCQVCRLLSAAAGDGVGVGLVSHVEGLAAGAAAEMVFRVVEGLAVGDAADDLISRVVGGQAAKHRKSLVVDWKMASVEGCHEGRS